MPCCTIANVKIHIEVPLLLSFFSFIFFESVKTNLIIYRTCYVTLGYNQSECALLGGKETDNKTEHLEKLVEPYAAVINMVQSLSEGCVSAIICLFVGPWSDRFGRKPGLVLPVIGFTLYYILYVIFALLENISPWYSIICSIPIYLTGGTASYLTVLLCYITDVTDENNRGMRMGIFEAVLAIGIFLANVSNSYVFAATNYQTVFMISAFCMFLGLLFTIFFIPESLSNPETQNKLSGFFQITNIKDMVTTTFKKRQNYDRFVVLSCVLMLSAYILAINGDSAVIFLFLRNKFEWSLQQYTLFSAAHNVSWVLGTVIGIYILHKLIKIPESVMIVLGFGSMLVGMVFMGLARYNWEIYGAAFSRALGGVLSPMVRSLVSKIVPGDEVGKIFSLIVASESLIGLGGSPIYTAIYNSTISIDPGIFNFFSAGIYGFEMVLAICVILARRKRREDVVYDGLLNEEEERSIIEDGSA